MSCSTCVVIHVFLFASNSTGVDKLEHHFLPKDYFLFLIIIGNETECFFTHFFIRRQMNAFAHSNIASPPTNAIRRQ